VAKKKGKPDPYSQQAANLSLTRYGPEISTLTALLRQAEEDRDLRLRQAKSGRQYAVGAVNAARPEVTHSYEAAAGAVQPAFAQGGGIEAEALQARLGEGAALARTQLANRRVSAIEGEGAARTAAFTDFRSDRGKIAQRALDLSREQGAFQASTITDLIGADAAGRAATAKAQAGLDQSERNSQRSAGIDPDTGLPIPGGKLDPKAHPPKGSGSGGGGADWAPQGAQATARTTIASALNAAKSLKGLGVDRHDAAKALLQGAEPVPLYDTTTGKALIWQKGEKGNENGELTGQKKTSASLPKVDDQLYLSAALDMAYDGHLSRRNQRLLHQNQIKIQPLGVTTYQEWLRELDKATRRMPGSRGTVKAPGANGQSRPT
jgi:hypothetical protein